MILIVYFIIDPIDPIESIKFIYLNQMMVSLNLKVNSISTSIVTFENAGNYV
jgi:hypothetical protein